MRRASPSAPPSARPAAPAGTATRAPSAPCRPTSAPGVAPKGTPDADRTSAGAAHRSAPRRRAAHPPDPPPRERTRSATQPAARSPAPPALARPVRVMKRRPLHPARRGPRLGESTSGTGLVRAPISRATFTRRLPPPKRRIRPGRERYTRAVLSERIGHVVGRERHAHDAHRPQPANRRSGRRATPPTPARGPPRLPPRRRARRGPGPVTTA